MKKFLLLVPLFGLLTGCAKSYDKSLIKEAAKPIEKKYSIKDKESYKEVFNSLLSFNSSFFDEYVKSETKNDKNYAISPISLYFALAMAAECSKGNTRNEILNVLGVSYETLSNNLKYLYSFVNYCENDKNPNRQHNYEELTNSIWLSKNLEYNKDCVDKLANDYFAYSFHEDFKNDNRNANKRMSQFVSDKTYKMIKPEFKFDQLTNFVLLNTLYLKSVWNSDGDSLEFTNESHDFKNMDGSITSTKLLHKDYVAGKILRNEKYSSFFVSTSNNVTIKFILPNDGISLKQVLVKDVFEEINSETYESYFEESNTKYYTEVNFPEYKADCDINAKQILQNLGINDLFTANCDFSNITDSKVSCGEVKHITKLEVDKKGIKGASFTTIPLCGSAGPDECKKIYETFTLDKPFGFIIYDTNSNPVFSGFVNKI